MYSFLLRAAISRLVERKYQSIFSHLYKLNHVESILYESLYSVIISFDSGSKMKYHCTSCYGFQVV